MGAAGSGRDAVAPRLRWAVELVDASSGDQLLEVGCGPGVAAGLVCDGLTTGRLLAVDRSAVAIQRAATRNAEHLAAGRLELRRAALADLVLPPSSLDTAFAVDVNVFWVSPAVRELQVLQAALRPGGAVHLLWGSGGPTAADRITGPVAAALRQHGFVDVLVGHEPVGVGVSARAPG